MEVPKPDGSYEYVEAEKGLAYLELPNGKYVAIRDMAEARRQASGDSHMAHFFQEKDGKVVKQHMKRLNALERQMNQMMVDRVLPGASPNVQTIKDEEFESLLAMYQQALAEGREKECEFQPLNTYVNKLMTSSGKVIRPLLKGEVGMRGPVILILEQGYGTGNFVQVK